MSLAAREYRPTLLLAIGAGLVLVGALSLIFPHPFERFIARNRPGTDETTRGDRETNRVWGIGTVVVGAICLVIFIVRLVA